MQAEVWCGIFPGLAWGAGHEFCGRGFDGAAGLVGVLLDDMTPKEHSSFFNQFRFVQLGASWGGFESLIVPAWPAPERSCTPLQKGSLIRVHAGLETGEALIENGRAACRTRVCQYE